MILHHYIWGDIDIDIVEEVAPHLLRSFGVDTTSQGKTLRCATSMTSVVQKGTRTQHKNRGGYPRMG